MCISWLGWPTVNVFCLTSRSVAAYKQQTTKCLNKSNTLRRTTSNKMILYAGQYPTKITLHCMEETIPQNDALCRTTSHKNYSTQDNIQQNDTLRRTISNKNYSTLYVGHYPTKRSSKLLAGLTAPRFSMLFLSMPAVCLASDQRLAMAAFWYSSSSSFSTVHS